MYDPDTWRGDRPAARAAAAVDVAPHPRSPKVTVAERLAHLRRCCVAARSTSTRRSRSADRVTVAVTLFSLLELYKQGELTWSQDQPFGEIKVRRATAAARHREE